MLGRVSSRNINSDTMSNGVDKPHAICDNVAVGVVVIVVVVAAQSDNTLRQKSI